MSDLRKLYNSKVYMAELFTRPLEVMHGKFGIPHSGVRVTLEDGSKWLIHKGKGYGESTQTVVVAACHMSSNWKFKQQKIFGGSKTVSDLVRDGGTDYHLLFDNCYHAANRMMVG